VVDATDAVRRGGGYVRGILELEGVNAADAVDGVFSQTAASAVGWLLIGPFYYSHATGASH